MMWAIRNCLLIAIAAGAVVMAALVWELWRLL